MNKQDMILLILVIGLATLDMLIPKIKKIKKW